MKNVNDIMGARLAVEQQLSRADIGNTHQRAMLVGMLTALQWVCEVGVKDRNTLQQLIDGRPVLPNGETVYEAHARQSTEEAQRSRKGRKVILPVQ